MQSSIANILAWTQAYRTAMTKPEWCEWCSKSCCFTNQITASLCTSSQQHIIIVELLNELRPFSGRKNVVGCLISSSIPHHRPPTKMGLECCQLADVAAVVRRQRHDHGIGSMEHSKPHTMLCSSSSEAD
jgi:hypothetical protein